MKAPVSWIREYVDLPADVTTEDLAARLTALGLKLEAIEKPGDQITGPLVVGKVLTMEPEPQKNGKTINWCTVDVGDANGTGEPQGIVCGAHNFAPGDLVVVVLPGGVLPGDFEISARKTYGHVSAGMICSARELGLGEDHDGIIVLPADAGAPGDDAFDGARPRRRGHRVRDQPRPRLRAVAARRRPRGRAGVRRAVPRPGRPRRSPSPTRDGYPVEIDDPAGCPVFVARKVTGFDPAAASPDWMVRRLTQAGMRPISLAVDVTNYVMLEIGRPIHGYDADKLTGPIRVRRATEGERLTTLDGVDRALSTEDLVVTDDSGIIGLGGVMGGETTEMSADHDVGAGRGGPLGRHVDVPHRQAPQAHLRGRQAQRARRRPGRHPGGGRPRGRAAHDVRRRHGRPRRHRRRHATGAADRSRWPTTCPPG